MKNKLTTLAVVLLACMNVLTFVYASQSTAQIEGLKKSVDAKTNKIVVYNGKDGETPVKGVDYFDGANGINAMSYTVNTTVVKEVPLIGRPGSDGKDGKDGENGKDAPIQELRVNSFTGDVETKLSSDVFWRVMIPCSELKVGCPGE